MTDETRGSAPLTNAMPPTPQELVASVQARLTVLEGEIQKEHDLQAASRGRVRGHREEMKELRLMLPRKPRAKKAKATTEPPSPLGN